MKEINRIDIERLRDTLSVSKKITLTAHTHPDGDAIGSCIGMAEYLRSIGKDVIISLPDEIDDYLQFILSPLSSEYIHIYSAEPEKMSDRLLSSDLIICQDYNSFSRTDCMEDDLKTSKAAKILIDHHLNPDKEDFSIIFSDTEVSSTCELLFYILMEMPEINQDVRKLSLECATALMTGMTTDTNNFANSVYPTTFKMASSLLEAGVDRESIISSLYKNYNESRLRAMGYMLLKSMEITNEGIAYMIMTQEIMNRYEINHGDTEGFVNLPLSIGKVKMSIFLKEDGDHFRVSIRSKENVSANKMAVQYFNGGGHEKAAGGKIPIPNDTTEPFIFAKEYILNAIKKYFEE